MNTETHQDKRTVAPKSMEKEGAKMPKSVPLDDVLREVCGRVAQVWPLTNFIAVNPLQGFESERFAEADATARKFFRARALPKLSYFHRKFREGRIRFETLRTVAEQYAHIGPPDTVARALKEHALESLEKDEKAVTSEECFLTLSEWCDELLSTRLSGALDAELVKWCSAYFDLGEAAWPMPGKQDGFYAAWKRLARFDRNYESAGVAGFSAFVEALPASPRDAIAQCLEKLGVPETLWRDYLLRHLCSMPGWSGMFAHFGAEQSHAVGGDTQSPLLDYLAVRLAYDAAGADIVGRERLESVNAWTGLVGLALRRFAEMPGAEAKPWLGPSAALVWLEAFEKEYRDRLLRQLGEESRQLGRTPAKVSRPDVQAVFCIDVRSECLRRHLESVGNVETFGFAGFFAIPLAYRPLGEDYVEPQCPVLIRPKFVVADRLAERDAETGWLARRRAARAVQSAVKEVKNTAIAPFALVETFGFIGAWKMLVHTFWPSLLAKKIGPAKERREVTLASDVEGKTSLYHGGIPLADRVAIAENSMRIMGLGVGGAPIARLVVLCGHGSSTTNNAYASALDCGACGGHRGAPNARVAAAIFNDLDVRRQLAERGLPIPEDTWFVAAEHDSATDDVRVYGVEAIPERYRSDLAVFDGQMNQARQNLNLERTRRFDTPATSVAGAEREVRRRSLDWSEARPEWGLAGNAAFVIGRRELTKRVNLGGRSFLHSYRWETDPSGGALEVILTAPMVVTEWINTQYFFSSVDNEAFGSGTKVIHNVVGKLGVMQGNQSDLKIGLPLQSVSDGDDLVHEPMRLCVVVEAPKERIAAIVAKHESVRKLLDNEWLQLVALDPVEQDAFRYRPGVTWQREAAFAGGDRTAVPASPAVH